MPRSMSINYKWVAIQENHDSHDLRKVSDEIIFNGTTDMATIFIQIAIPKLSNAKPQRFKILFAALRKKLQ
jgi:hypothetical protein